jgi:hypothetical protein
MLENRSSRHLEPTRRCSHLNHLLKFQYRFLLLNTSGHCRCGLFNSFGAISYNIIYSSADSEQIRKVFIFTVLDRFVGLTGRTQSQVKAPLLSRIVAWAEEYCGLLNTASEEIMLPLAQNELPSDPAKLIVIRERVTQMAQKAQRHNITMSKK